ncbi:MAG: methyltransferase domain-containing protein [Sphingomonadales bacterium]|nr:methyltransferase domain-containing protein [Sphingomonadales bacterium]MDE2169515.1 methyltransferase domain-containing protein [Sphingomonadales bacterium]
MDSVYRGQRHIYDATRKFFLFGRDRLIDGLGLLPGTSLLEIGCGTGRNLAAADACWPGGRLFGLDISELMLKSAKAKLGKQARLAQGDACGFSPRALFGQPTFDRVMISFALSMIPEWQRALAMGCEVLAPGGSLHIVDFGDGSGLPAIARKALNRWLAHFHVTPRLDLADTAWQIARERGLRVETIRGPMGYYQIVVVRKTR